MSRAKDRRRKTKSKERSAVGSKSANVLSSSPKKPSSQSQPSSSGDADLSAGAPVDNPSSWRGQNPMPFFKKRGGALVDGALYTILTAIFGVAARNTQGWLNLVLALLAVATFAGLFQALGVIIAHRWSGLRTIEKVAVFILAKWIFIGGFVYLPRILGFIGVTADQQSQLMLGAGIGAVAATALWIIGFRFIYRPVKLPRWLLRGSMQLCIMLCGMIALAVG